MSTVEAGFFSLTEVTVASEHRRYNAWHMLDHLPEQLTLPGIGWGERWVSTPACRLARAVSTAPFDDVHYLTLYLLSPPVDRTLDEFGRLARQLSDRGRFHRHRRTALTGAFDVVDTAAAARVRISAGAVPYRPNRGIHVRVEEVVDQRRLDDHLRWFALEHLPALLGLPGVAGVWTFAAAAAARRRDGEARPVTATASRITMTWLDGPVLDAAVGIGDLAPPSEGAVRPLLDGPFERIEPYRWDWFDDDAG